MSAVVLALGLAMGTSAGAEVPGKQFTIDLRLCQGDPLGSREAGTVKHLMEPRVTTGEGRPASFLSGGEMVLKMPNGKLSQEWVGTRIQVLPVNCQNRTAWAELNITRRMVNPGLGVMVGKETIPGFTEEAIRISVTLKPGETVRWRLAANSATDQTWIELTATEVPAGK